MNINPYILPGLTTLVRREFLLNTILSHTAQAFGVTVDDIKSPSRKREIALARHAYCLLAIEHSNNKLAAIGMLINREHPAVLHCKKAALNLIETNDPLFVPRYRKLKERF